MNLVCVCLFVACVYGFPTILNALISLYFFPYISVKVIFQNTRTQSLMFLCSTSPGSLWKLPIKICTRLVEHFIFPRVILPQSSFKIRELVLLHGHHNYSPLEICKENSFSKVWWLCRFGSIAFGDAN